MPSPKLTALLADLQFALVLLYSVLARNKPGMDPVVSLLFLCWLSRAATCCVEKLPSTGRCLSSSH